MKRLNTLGKDEHGVAALEMAFALPVLILFIWGTFQVGVALQALSGMQHALGEGARYATICVTPNPLTGCATPTDTQIADRIRENVFGVNVGTFSDPEISTPEEAVCSNCRLATVDFSMPMNFLFFDGPTVTLSRSKVIYLA